MGFEALQDELRRMGDVTRGLAALGATLRLRQGNMTAHPEVGARLAEAVAALLPGGLSELDDDQAATALNLVMFAMEEARDLFERPDGPPAWEVREPAMLQAQGEASRAIVHGLIALSAERPALAAALDRRMLDVGTGVAALALEAVTQRPSLHVVGIDIWEPALALARANVKASSHAARIELRMQDVTGLDEVAGYSLAWLPAPFLSRAVIEAALDRLVVALEPGGYLAVGLSLAPADTIGAALAALRLTRSGGHLWQDSALESELSNRGLGAVETCSGPPGVTFVLGRRT
jgi:SAM-dependent methyltransferase